MNVDKEELLIGRGRTSYDPNSGYLRKVFLGLAFHIFAGHCRNKGHNMKFNGIKTRCVICFLWGHICCYELKGVTGLYSKNVLLSLIPIINAIRENSLWLFVIVFFCKDQLLSIICIFKDILIKIWKETGITGMSVLSLYSPRSVPKKIF